MTKSPNSATGSNPSFSLYHAFARARSDAASMTLSVCADPWPGGAWIRATVLPSGSLNHAVSPPAGSLHDAVLGLDLAEVIVLERHAAAFELATSAVRSSTFQFMTVFFAVPANCVGGTGVRVADLVDEGPGDLRDGERLPAELVGIPGPGSVEIRDREGRVDGRIGNRHVDLRVVPAAYPRSIETAV